MTVIADNLDIAMFVVLMVLARLQAINPKLYEAAMVNGAGPIRCFSRTASGT